MSEENVDTIRQMIERANSAGWDAALLVSNWVHPEARVYPAADFPGPDLYVGREEITAFVQEWTSTFDDLSWKVEQLIDLGDQVVVLARMTGKSRTTGASVDWPFGGLFGDFRDGMFAETRYFMDQESALEAVGLSEQDARSS